MTFCKDLEKRIQGEIEEKRKDGTAGNNLEVDLMLEDIERDEVKTSQVKPIGVISGRE